MLQRVDTEILREAARRDLASALHRVEADVAHVLACWPGGAGGGESIARFGAAPDGKLVQLCGRTPKRSRRRAPGPGEGRLVYAVGDVHGCYDLLIDLLARLGRDAAAAGGARAPTLILLGDYVDRGPDSARVLEALSLLKARAPFELCLLKGNHEEALLRFLDAPAEAGPWFGFGGAETLASYGVEPPVADDPSAYVAARDELLRRMPAAHLRLLQTLDLMALAGDYAFVHAGVAPGEPLAQQSARDLLWIRREFLEARRPFEKVIVHGHTWADDEPAVTPVRIGLDTGAYETGVLSAMRFQDKSRTCLHVRDPSRPRWRRPGAPKPWSPVAQPLEFTGAAVERMWTPVVTG